MCGSGAARNIKKGKIENSTCYSCLSEWCMYISKNHYAFWKEVSRMLNREIIEKLRNEYPAGCRVELLKNRILKHLRCGLSSCDDTRDIGSYPNSIFLTTKVRITHFWWRRRETELRFPLQSQAFICNPCKSSLTLVRIWVSESTWMILYRAWPHNHSHYFFICRKYHSGYRPDNPCRLPAHRYKTPGEIYCGGNCPVDAVPCTCFFVQPRVIPFFEKLIKAILSCRSRSISPRQAYLLCVFFRCIP